MAIHADYYIGVMSGTSLDAIDVALVDFSQKPASRLVFAMNHPLPEILRHDILTLCHRGADELHRMATLDRQLGQLFADAVNALLEQTGLNATQITAIGSHGQTVRHAPAGSYGYSWQIGDPNTIALATGITTVADFRRMDVAAGGEGAPLVPAFHDQVLRCNDKTRVVANIGGISNLTLLAPGQITTGFDTGPGNILLDAWILQQRGLNFDAGGLWAASGELHHPLLERMMADPYLQQPAPKSTGRERFHSEWLQQHLDALPSYAPADVQRTLLEFTARSLCLGIEQFNQPVDEVLLCGGGARNDLLLQRIRDLLPASSVTTTDSLGVAADWLEAYAFAWLAKQRLQHEPANCPEVTGAQQSCILGGVYRAYRHV